MPSERLVTDGVETVGKPAGPQREIRSLTGLRAVAAAWVVLFHFSFTPGDAWTPYWQFLRPAIGSGTLGVDLFFVLSGFVITLTYLDTVGPRWSVRGSAGFLWARICRVWPVHALVTTVFGAWLLWKSTRVSDGYLAYQAIQPKVDLPHLAEQLLMVQLWHRPTHQGASFVGPAWSLSAEWLAYVVFPVLALVLWRLRNAPVLVTGALAVASLVPFGYLSYSGGVVDFHYAWLLRIGGAFLAGAFTCLTVRRIHWSPRVDGVAALVAGVAVLEILVGLWWAEWRGWGHDGVVVVFFPVLIGALALSSRGPSRLLARPAMVHGGKISFALYLVHIPVFEVFWTVMGWSPRLAPGSGLGTLLIPHVLLLVVVLAHLTYRYVEEPARQALRRRGPDARRAVPDPVAVVVLPEAALPAASLPRPRDEKVAEPA